jgi:hypothetical protein
MAALKKRSILKGMYVVEIQGAQSRDLGLPKRIPSWSRGFLSAFTDEGGN